MEGARDILQLIPGAWEWRAGRVEARGEGGVKGCEGRCMQRFQAPGVFSYRCSIGLESELTGGTRPEGRRRRNPFDGDRGRVPGTVLAKGGGVGLEPIAALRCLTR